MQALQCAPRRRSAAAQSPRRRVSVGGADERVPGGKRAPRSRARAVADAGAQRHARRREGVEPAEERHRRRAARDRGGRRGGEHEYRQRGRNFAQFWKRDAARCSTSICSSQSAGANATIMADAMMLPVETRMNQDAHDGASARVRRRDVVDRSRAGDVERGIRVVHSGHFGRCEVEEDSRPLVRPRSQARRARLPPHSPRRKYAGTQCATFSRYFMRGRRSLAAGAAVAASGPCLVRRRSFCSPTRSFRGRARRRACRRRSWAAVPPCRCAL